MSAFATPTAVTLPAALIPFAPSATPTAATLPAVQIPSALYVTPTAYTLHDTTAASAVTTSPTTPVLPATTSIISTPDLSATTTAIATSLTSMSTPLENSVALTTTACAAITDTFADLSIPSASVLPAAKKALANPNRPENSEVPLTALQWLSQGRNRRARHVAQKFMFLHKPPIIHGARIPCVSHSSLPIQASSADFEGEAEVGPIGARLAVARGTTAIWQTRRRCHNRLLPAPVLLEPEYGLISSSARSCAARFNE